MLSPKLLELLACPSCKGVLHDDSQNRRLICPIEHLAFPVQGGVPMLLLSLALKLTD